MHLELFVYISGDFHEGTNDDILSPMFRDLVAVKAAWNGLVEANKKNIYYSLNGFKADSIESMEQEYTDATQYSLKEDLENGRARKETRADFLRKSVEAGYRILEGENAAFGYRSVHWKSAGENARQIQKELNTLGIVSEIFEGNISGI